MLGFDQIAKLICKHTLANTTSSGFDGVLGIGELTRPPL